MEKYDSEAPKINNYGYISPTILGSRVNFPMNNLLDLREK